MKDRTFRGRGRRLPVFPVFVILAGSASGESIEQPSVRIVGTEEALSGAEPDSRPSREQLSASITALFSAEDRPQGYVFCEAIPETGQCDDTGDGLSAVGVGGLFIPLVMDVSGMTIGSAASTADGWAITSAFQSTVNAIPPVCADADGTITVEDTTGAVDGCGSRRAPLVRRAPVQP